MINENPASNRDQGAERGEAESLRERLRAVEAELREAQTSRAKDLAAMAQLQELGAKLRAFGEEEELLEQILDGALALQGADAGTIRLLRPESGILEIVAHRNLTEEFLEHFRQVPVSSPQGCGLALRERRRIVVEDVELDPSYAPVLGVLRRAGVRAKHYIPLLDKAGEPIGLLGTYFRQPYRPTEREWRVAGLHAQEAADAIAARLADRTARESEERLRLVIESAREYAIFSTGLDLRITTWNSGAERLLGFTEGEAVGKNSSMIFTPEDRAAGAPELEKNQALESGRANDERWHLRKDGSRFWSKGFLMAMRDDAGKALGFVKILRDETESRQIQEALEQSRTELWEAVQENEAARNEAEAAGRAKDHFLAVLSHELRTPLTPVLMAVHTLLRRGDLSAPVADALEMIKRNVEIEAHFIDDLLDLTRIARGKIEIVREEMDLHDAIRHAISISQPDIDNKDQRLIVELNATDYILQGDHPRLLQAFWNLLKNAAKFTPDQGQIWLRTRNQPGRIVVEIQDTGIGIEVEEFSRIFSAFEQANHAVMQRFGGLGLGLAIAKATVEAHGGFITAASEGQGKGSVFTVILPLGSGS